MKIRRLLNGWGVLNLLIGFRLGNKIVNLRKLFRGGFRINKVEF